ncbi:MULTISPECIES: hypothetical protein [Halomonadaceae]|uniref:hypothetical protein n=1 Tax=Halomonadaceae TaxID=28256 RepID=UPI0015822C35|nr:MULTISPECIES: hypothetical protein [Halomonas]MDI4637504.1 hypothetical protein [Halomonas sp. BMC7]NUJ61338.1 hypothetical protein [Halomonas taeanensis]
MTKINTIGPKGDTFLVHTNDYDIQYDAVNVTVAGSAGDILEDASTKVSATSTEVLGILAEETDGSAGPVRVMTRGNPSSVDHQKLNYNDATEADVQGWLEDAGIVVVNK